MGFVESHGDYSLDDDRKSFPATHLGASVGLDYTNYLFETGISVEGAVFKEELVVVDTSAHFIWFFDAYDISSYIAIPLDSLS